MNCRWFKAFRASPGKIQPLLLSDLEGLGKAQLIEVPQPDTGGAHTTNNGLVTYEFAGPPIPHTLDSEGLYQA